MTSLPVPPEYSNAAYRNCTKVASGTRQHDMALLQKIHYIIVDHWEDRTSQSLSCYFSILLSISRHPHMDRTFLSDIVRFGALWLLGDNPSPPDVW